MSILRTNQTTKNLSIERLSEAVEYNPETGDFRWRHRPESHFQGKSMSADRMRNRWNGKYSGKPALTCVDPRGYAKGEIDGCFVWAHRVAWALVNGEWSTKEIDHINRDKRDNRLSNLREVTHRVNALNRVQGGKRGPRS